MQEDLNSRMIEDAILILRSVAFLEKEIYKKLSQVEEATNNNYYEDKDKLELELKALLSKINNENTNMNVFMDKYKKEINEKKAILLNSK